MFYQIVLIYAVFVFFWLQNTPAQWIPIYNLPDINLTSVCFNGPDAIFITAEEGRFFLSLDGGESWSNKNLTEAVNLNSISINNSVCYVAGDSGKIYRSYLENIFPDQWVEISLNRDIHLKDISFIDHFNGAAGGKKEVCIDGKKYCLPSINITTNGGAVWFEKEMDFRGVVNSITYELEGIILAAGDSGRVFRSSDYGNTWSIIQTPVLANLNKIKVCPNGTSVICGDKGTVLFSHDLGETWILNQAPEYYSLQSICYSENGTMVAAGLKEVRVDGKNYKMAVILSFLPGINEWNEEFCEQQGSYNSVSFCGNAIAAAVGDSGLTVLFKDPSGVQSIKENNNTNFSSLSPNYPNPFNPVTSFNYTLSKSGKVIITLYDLQGRSAELVNEVKPAGTYTFKLDMSTFKNNELSGGVYFYRLFTKDFIDTKKMILLK